jgi:hypothetical protein
LESARDYDMMTELEEGEESNIKKVIFKCKFCEEPIPLGEMVLLSRYFPEIIACRDFEKKIR